MNNSKIIEVFEALLDGYMPSTGESIENNLIINDRLIARSLQSAIFKLKINSLPIKKDSNNNSQLLKARKRFPRAYEPWSEKEDSILEDLVEKNFSVKDISAILERQVGAIKSRLGKKEIYRESDTIRNDSVQISKIESDLGEAIKKAQEARAQAHSLTKAQRAPASTEKKKKNKRRERWIADAKEKTVVENVRKTIIKKESKGAPKEDNFTTSVNSVQCIYCKDFFPIERQRLGYKYCVKCSSEKSKTFVDKGFQTREGHKIMNSKGYRNSKNK